MLGRLADRMALLVAHNRVRRNVPDGCRLNLGSGLSVAPGWIHVDASLHSLLAGAPAPLLRRVYRSANTVKWISEDEYVRRLREHTFIHADITRRLPFPDSIAGFVYMSHVLEHFYLAEGMRILREIHRVLKPTGVVRICVPDLEHAVRMYLQGNRREAVAYFYTDEPAPALRTHRYMYDEALLSDALHEAGFTDVRRCSYQQGSVPDLELLDNRPEETLYMEAAKAA
ncbi:MAG: methyltransferase domain-containing protein [Candidatus Cloacimonetes bacterium]|nr:methyltransferase domain-containing protein [Candidatus Cloacimonadota bacterium]